MKIGLVSDTHSYLDPLIFKYFENCDAVWHAGDIGSVETAKKLAELKNFSAVSGNIDNKELRLLYPEELLFMCEGMRIYITHIGGYPPKYTTQLKKKLDLHKPDIFICGHSHILRVIRDAERNLLHINPGAAGKEGFHKVRTIITFELNDKKITDFKVIELGAR